MKYVYELLEEQLELMKDEIKFADKEELKELSSRNEQIGKALRILKESERQQSNDVSNNAETKALSIADVVRSYSKKDIISLLEDRKNHFKPKDYYKNERMRLTQAINTINGLVPDF